MHFSRKEERMHAMTTRHHFLRTVVAAGIVGATLAACGQMRPSRSADIFEATMSGAQEVPPVSTSGAGSAEVTLNNSTNLLTWKVTYSGLSGPAVAGHIHGPADPGQNAGVLIPFTSVGTQPISGQTTLTPQQVADLAAGKWYVNIHTPSHPGGEIRGQLRRRQ
jgi:hypothetical protein